MTISFGLCSLGVGYGQLIFSRIWNALNGATIERPRSVIPDAQGMAVITLPFGALECSANERIADQ
jgi:hypothetical protein